MLTIYFIRHGESQGNREDRFRGRHDFPLNENGIRQAESLRDALKAVPLEKVYSSPLSRSLQTARILAGETIALEVKNGLTNISLGDWENKLKSDIRQRHPELWATWTTTPEKLSFPGMETLAQVQKRAFDSAMKITGEHPAGTIAIVTHRAVLKPLFAAMLNMQSPYFWKLHMDTASYSIIEYREKRGFTMTLLNETDHLADFVREDTA